MTVYDRHHPFFSKIKDRFRLNKEGSTRETWHFVLDLASSGIDYKPGDSIAILPQNDREEVEKILLHLGASGDESVQGVDTDPISIREHLRQRVNLAVPTKKLLLALNDFRFLGSDEVIKQVIATHNVEEVLSGHQMTYEHFLPLLSPLLPRFYSIASSKAYAGDEVHLTVARVQYEVSGKERRGVCSHFLCDQIDVEKQKVGIYLQPTRDFRLPANDETPIIMIGPGTGVAPFRAFMQEKLQHAKTKDNCWLYFGERHSATDFFYETFWQELVDAQMLRLDVAFSRDQKEKIYVQHRMWEKRKDFWKWLENGAVIYVCGNASHMAKDVDAMLHTIAESEGNMTHEKAREFVKKLRHEKRYIRDVY